jgi:hypothetical protein
LVIYVREPLPIVGVNLGHPVLEGYALHFILDFAPAEDALKRDELSLLENSTALYFLKTCIISCS